MTHRLILALAGAAGALAALPASAAEPDVTGWHGSVTPYLWMAGVKGSLQSSPIADNLPPGTGDIDVSFLDVLSHLGFAFMGAGDVRYNRLGAIVDFDYIKISDTKGITLGDRNLNAHTTVKTTMATIGSYYRVYSGHSGSLDLVAGARINSINLGVNLSDASGVGDGVNRGFTRTLTDPVFGLRGVARLNDRWSLNGYGDVGGVSGSLVYQLVGGVDYTWSKHWSSGLSFRYYVVNIYGQNIDLGYHLSLVGPVLGATYRF